MQRSISFSILGLISGTFHSINAIPSNLSDIFALEVEFLNLHMEENNWSQVHVATGTIPRILRYTLKLLKFLKLILFSIDEMLSDDN